MLVLCMNLKIFGKLLTSKSVEIGPSSYEKRIYRAAVSQRLRNTDLDKYLRGTKGPLEAYLHRDQKERLKPIIPFNFTNSTLFRLMTACSLEKCADVSEDHTVTSLGCAHSFSHLYISAQIFQTTDL